MLEAGATSKTLIEYGGTTAVHTLGHRSIGDRPSVSSDNGPGLRRGASVQFGHGRADHGRYCLAGRGRTDGEEGRAASGAESAAFRRLRPFLAIRSFEFAGACRRTGDCNAATRTGGAVDTAS